MKGVCIAMWGSSIFLLFFLRLSKAIASESPKQSSDDAGKVEQGDSRIFQIPSGSNPQGALSDASETKSGALAQPFEVLGGGLREAAQELSSSLKELIGFLKLLEEKINSNDLIRLTQEKLLSVALGTAGSQAIQAPQSTAVLLRNFLTTNNDEFWEKILAGYQGSSLPITENLIVAPKRSGVLGSILRTSQEAANSTFSPQSLPDSSLPVEYAIPASSNGSILTTLQYFIPLLAQLNNTDRTQLETVLNSIAGSVLNQGELNSLLSLVTMFVDGVAMPGKLTGPPSDDVISISRDEFEQRMVTRHNDLRVSAGVPPLEWDEGLAKFALSYLTGTGIFSSQDQCVFAASTKRQRVRDFTNVGENIYMSGRTIPTPEQVVDVWYNEIYCYRYGPVQTTCSIKTTEKCRTPGVIGHFTQVMWDTTTHVGCAAHKCTNCYRICPEIFVSCVYGSYIVPYGGNVSGGFPFSSSVARNLQLPFCSNLDLAQPLSDSHIVVPSPVYVDSYSE